MIYHLAIAFAGMAVLGGLWLGVQWLMRRGDGKDPNALACWACEESEEACHTCGLRSAFDHEHKTAQGAKR